MSGLLASSRRVDVDAAPPLLPADHLPEPSLGAQAAASFRTSQDDVHAINEGRLSDAYIDLERQLIRTGANRLDLLTPESRNFVLQARAGNISSAYGGAPAGGDDITGISRDMVWREVMRQRINNPHAFAELPANREEYERDILTRHGEQARDLAIQARGTGLDSVLAQMAGGMAGAFTDPVNIATLPFGGGGKTIVQFMAREALFNGLVEAVQQPQLSVTREAQGRELTGEEAVMNIATAAGGGAVLGGAGRAFSDHVTPRIAEAIYARLPATVRDRFASIDLVPDHVIADAFEEIRGVDISPDERAAIASIRQAHTTASGNPFVRDAAGNAAHEARLRETMATILDNNPPSPIARLAASPGPAPSARARLSAGTTLARDTSDSGYASSPARQAIKARIGGAESSGGRNYANPQSSARGLYQFIDGTWLSYYRRRFGNDGHSDAAVLGMRRDNRLQNILMDDLLADNARFLASRNEPETAGNLYLVHFAGQGGARRLFDADPRSRVEDVLGQSVVNANPFLRGMSAGDVIAWAARRMDGSATPARAGGRAALADYDSEDAIQAQIQSELDALTVRQRELDAEQIANDPLRYDQSEVFPARPPIDDRLLDESLVPPPSHSAADLIDQGNDALVVHSQPHEVVGVPIDHRQSETFARTVERLSDVVTRSQNSLNDMTALVRKVQASEPEIRAAIKDLSERQMVVIQRSGRITRVPTHSGPEDAFQMIARIGGWKDSPSARGRGEHDLATRFQRRDGRGSIFIPGHGPLIRPMDSPRAKTSDQIGEYLYEGGFLFSREAGNERGRPSVSEVLDYMEGGIGNRRALLPEHDLTYIEAKARADGPDLSEAEQAAWHWGEREGVDITTDDAADMAEIIASSEANGKPISHDQALIMLVNQRTLDDLLDAWHEVADDADYFTAIADIANERAGEGGAGPAVADGFADPRGADVEAVAARDADYERWEIADDGWRDLEQPETDGPWRDSADSQDWSDPTGRVASEQSQSLTHDATAALTAGTDGADMFGGATRTEARQALERQGDAPLTNTAPQRPAGSDGGLFDVGGGGQQIDFLTDANGKPRSLSKIMAELDIDDAEIKALRDCI